MNRWPWDYGIAIPVGHMLPELGTLPLASDQTRPHRFGGWVSRPISRQIHEPLVGEDLSKPSAEVPVPPGALARGDLGLSPDGKIYTFHLRKNVKFHDGTDFNAAAVEFNVHRMWDKKLKWYDECSFHHGGACEGSLTRAVEAAALGLHALAGYDPLDPFSLDEQVDFTTALRRSVKGMRIAYSPDWDVYPVDSRVADVVRIAVQAFAEARAHIAEVKVGIKRSQRELSDRWCRLMMPINIGTFESLQQAGVDLLKDHREDLPPQYIEWVEKGRQMNLLDIARDQAMQTEICDAVQQVFQNCDLIITPTVACLPVDNADDGNTVGPSKITGEDVEPLSGWCMTYFTNFSGHPSASMPAGLAEGRYPVGMQIIGRQRSVRRAPALTSHV